MSAVLPACCLPILKSNTECGLVSGKQLETGMSVIPFGWLPGDRLLGLAGRHLIVCSSAAGVQRKVSSGKGSCF